jgi:hypothetical protein
MRGEWIRGYYASPGPDLRRSRCGVIAAQWYVGVVRASLG